MGGIREAWPGRSTLEGPSANQSRERGGGRSKCACPAWRTPAHPLRDSGDGREGSHIKYPKAGFWTTRVGARLRVCDGVGELHLQWRRPATRRQPKSTGRTSGKTGGHRVAATVDAPYHGKGGPARQVDRRLALAGVTLLAVYLVRMAEGMRAAATEAACTRRWHGEMAD